MTDRILSTQQLSAFRQYLLQEEKSRATLEKYLRALSGTQKCRHRRKLSEIHCSVFLSEEKQKTRIEALLKLRGATQ